MKKLVLMKSVIVLGAALLGSHAAADSPIRYAVNAYAHEFKNELVHHRSYKHRKYSRYGYNRYKRYNRGYRSKYYNSGRKFQRRGHFARKNRYRGAYRYRPYRY